MTVPGDPAGVQSLLDTGLDGQVHLPGTSLAGALREAVGEECREALFGPLLGADAEPRVSRVWVLGSRRIGDGKDYRTSTRIDRTRAAADPATLRTEEVLPAGSRFEVFLRWDDAGDGEVANLAKLLTAWRPFLGRGVSRGRGACEVESVRHGTLRLDEPAALLRWLTLSGPELARSVAVHEVPKAAQAAPDPLLRVTVSIDGPVRIGNGEKAGTDEPGKAIPLFRVGGAPVVPGSGLKGLLRSRAEFILRSVDVPAEPCQDQRCEKCWPCVVFGYGGGTDENSDSVGGRALIRIPDAEITGAVPAERTHVAIDRFTGGALDGALYTMEVLEAGTFELRVDLLDHDAEGLAEQIRAVLRLVLEDLDDGIIGLGGGVARGYGTVTVDFASSLLPGRDEARAVLRRMAEKGEHGAD
ncbi:RAMP superfamily CRISPR-associated protein [Trebonia sp.]|uniref:RAMP superfamily CRISPR-associated protein n=1 Tax=Trebonia sp. TaxID=2767075 RepID=UPI00261E4AC8|nr:RAMP superfamily CRISPR-associated protein [Trebonia sp.]